MFYDKKCPRQMPGRTVCRHLAAVLLPSQIPNYHRRLSAPESGCASPLLRFDRCFLSIWTSRREGDRLKDARNSMKCQITWCPAISGIISSVEHLGPSIGGALNVAYWHKRKLLFCYSVRFILTLLE